MIIMMVKCQCCGTMVDRKTAYKVETKSKNMYYCSEQEYIRMITAKAEIQKTEHEIMQMIYEIFGYEIKNTILFNELREIRKTFTLNILYHYMIDNYQEIGNYMSTKAFKNEYNKVRYFSAILKNNLGDYRIPEEQPVKESSADFETMKYKPKTKRKCLADYRNED